MTLVRANHDKSNPYVVINKSIVKNKTLSWKAKGLFLYAFSRPDDWTFNTEDLIANSQDGKDSVRAGLKESEREGYLERHQPRTSDGKMGPLEWVFHEKPRHKKAENPIPPQAGFPAPVNPPLLSNELLNKEVLSKESTSSSNFPMSEHAFRLSHLLFDFVKSRAPKAKEPDWDKWAVELDRMQRLDGYTWEEIEKLIRYVHQQDRFWFEVILSTKKLREKAVAITTKMSSNKEEERPKPEKQIVKTPEEIARRKAEYDLWKKDLEIEMEHREKLKQQHGGEDD